MGFEPTCCEHTTFVTIPTVPSSLFGPIRCIHYSTRLRGILIHHEVLISAGRMHFYQPRRLTSNLDYRPVIIDRFFKFFNGVDRGLVWIKLIFLVFSKTTVPFYTK